MHALTEFLELNVIDQLKILPGVGEVTLAGYQQRNLRVWVDNNKLKPLQLTMLDVKSALETEQVEEAAGYLENCADRVQRPHHGRRRHARGGRRHPDQEARRRGHLQFHHPHPRRRARGGRPRRRAPPGDRQRQAGHRHRHQEAARREFRRGGAGGEGAPGRAPARSCRPM